MTPLILSHSLLIAIIFLAHMGSRNGYDRSRPDAPKLCHRTCEANSTLSGTYFPFSIINIISKYKMSQAFFIPTSCGRDF